MFEYGGLPEFGYRKGAKNGAPQNWERAAAWYGLAAQQGHPGAQFQLGEMHYAGMGVTKDSSLMIYWYTQAANEGMPEAQKALGDAYLIGDGVSANMPYAARLYAAAAAQGYREAQNALAIHYEQGYGGYDLDQAVYWYSRAADQGDESATRSAKEIKEAVQILNAHMQSSGAQYAAVAAKAISGLPEGAIVCDSHDRVSFVTDLYVNYWKDYDLATKMGATKEQALKQLHGSPPSVGKYGCEMAGPGVKMYMETGSLVPVVVFVISAHKFFRGVTLEAKLKR
jgi:TPR repeat protein